MPDPLIPPMYRVLVIGANGARLAKIISLVKAHEENGEDDQVSNKTGILIEHIPCIAKMGHYRDESGSTVRYLNTFCCWDGSPMTKFFDDDEVRATIVGVLMVGYEWTIDGDTETGDHSFPNEAKRADDKAQIGNYIRSNQLLEQISIFECIKPNPEFNTLQAEMDHFKSLDELAKTQHMAHQSMGPGKMAKFVLDMTKQLREERGRQTGDGHQPVDNSGEKSAEEAVDEETESEPRSAPLRPPPDPNKTRFACRKCRNILFGEGDLAKGHVQNLHSFRRPNYDKNRRTQPCSSLFCGENVLEWLVNSNLDGVEASDDPSYSVEGKLTCPKCLSKVGHWNWSGAQCSCGTWVTPAIQIPLSKVDEIQSMSAAFSLNTPESVVIQPVTPKLV